MLPLKEKKMLRILLADDNENECSLFNNALDKMKVPHLCSVVKSCEMLLNMLDDQDFEPDYIFLHLNVPELTTDCLRAIKTRKKQIPVILYSESINTRDKDYCFNTNASEYFIKALNFLI